MNVSTRSQGSYGTMDWPVGIALGFGALIGFVLAMRTHDAVMAFHAVLFLSFCLGGIALLEACFSTDPNSPLRAPWAGIDGESSRRRQPFQLLGIPSKLLRSVQSQARGFSESKIPSDVRHGIDADALAELPEG